MLVHSLASQSSPPVVSRQTIHFQPTSIAPNQKLHSMTNSSWVPETQQIFCLWRFDSLRGGSESFLPLAVFASNPSDLTQRFCKKVKISEQMQVKSKLGEQTFAKPSTLCLYDSKTKINRNILFSLLPHICSCRFLFNLHTVHGHQK